MFLTGVVEDGASVQPVIFQSFATELLQFKILWWSYLIRLRYAQLKLKGSCDTAVCLQNQLLKPVLKLQTVQANIAVFAGIV